MKRRRIRLRHLVRHLLSLVFDKAPTLKSLVFDTRLGGFGTHCCHFVQYMLRLEYNDSDYIPDEHFFDDDHGAEVRTQDLCLA